MITGALSSGLVDRVWVIPSGYPPKKDAHLLTLAPYRFYMTQAALKNVPDCEVLPLEIVRPQKSYTVETLRILREEETAGPDDELCLLYGTDILFEIETWHCPDTLLKQAKLLLASRPGIMKQATLDQVRYLEEKYQIRISFFPIEGINVASRDIRARRAFSELLPPVRQFIGKHALYPEDNPLQYLKEDTHRVIFEHGTKLFMDLSRGRLLHSLNVALLAARYASIFCADPDAAVIAGLLHDCAKELPIGRQAEMARQTVDGDLPEKALLHAPAGVAYARERYGITDQLILDAIRYHTTGREEMTDLEKIIYLADKLEPARDYEDLTELREIALIDLDTAVIACLEAVKSSFERKNAAFHPDSSRALSSLIGHRTRKAKATENTKKSKEEKMDTLAISQDIVKILTEKKALDVELIPVHGKTVLADYFVIATGTSTTHIKSLSDEVEFVLKRDHNLMPDHIEGLSTGRWVLMDYKDIIVHIFHPEERGHYSLEKLWTTKHPSTPEITDISETEE